MSPGSAAVRGFLFGAAGITLACTLLGGFLRVGFGERARNFAEGATCAGMMCLYFLALPAGVIGAFLGALICWSRGKPEVDPGHKPRLRPLDD